MARPTKEGLEYFPLDTDIDQDEKIIVVVAKFGIKGFGVIIRLMMEVYKNGYYYHWTEKEQYVFSMKVGEPVEFLNEVVQECLKWGFFHQEIYENCEILTSKGFQKRYMLAVNRRKDVLIKKDHNLIDIENQAEPPINNQTGTKDLPEPDKTKAKKKIYDETNLYYKLAKYFYKKVTSVAESNGLKHLIIKADLQKWADEIRKLIELDKQDKQLIKDVMDWVVTDSFWKTNILSAKKLREKFTDLALKMSSSQKSKHNQSQNQTKQPDPRDKDIEFQKFLSEGGNPNDFNWGS